MASTGLAPSPRERCREATASERSTPPRLVALEACDANKGPSHGSDEHERRGTEHHSDRGVFTLLGQETQQVRVESAEVGRSD